MQSEHVIHEGAPSGAHPVGPGPETHGHGDGDDHGHVHLPPPSIWPISMAGGLALGGMGLVTIWPFSALGGILFVIALVSWIQELRVDNPVQGHD
jgi:hypothetical protein